MIDILFQQPTAWSIKRLTREFVHRFERTFFVPDVLIHVFDTSVIDLGPTIGFGCFLPEVDVIFMAGRRDLCLEDVSYSWEEIYLGFLAHEFVHVEQKYLGKQIQERGVRKRSRTFLRSLGFREVWI